MSLSSYYLNYGRHLARFRHRRRGRAYAPMSNTASHDITMRKFIDGFPFLMSMGLRLAVLWAAGAPLKIKIKTKSPFFETS